MGYVQNYQRYGNETHSNMSNSLSLRPSLSPSFSLPGITTPNLGIRPETIILVGGGILLLAYLSKGNGGLTSLGTSTTGAVTNVADAIGNTAGLVANVSDKANRGIDAIFDFGYGIGKASADGWTSVSKTIGEIASGNAAAGRVGGTGVSGVLSSESVKTAASVVSGAAFTPAKAVDSVKTAASVVSGAAQTALRSVNDASASLFKRLEKYRYLYIVCEPIMYCRFKHRAGQW